MNGLVLLPPVIAIALALWTRQVYLSLLAGLWFGTSLLEGGNPVGGLRRLLEEMVGVFSDAGNTRVVMFCLLVGGLIALVQASGGVEGFVTWAASRGWGRTRRGAELLAWAVGMLVFVESSITCLAVGAVCRPFFDRLQLPREKLAYYCDTTSAPVCMAIPLNGWGAYVLGLLAAQGVTTGAVSLFGRSLLFNFYCLLSIAFALVLALTGWRWGAMRHAEERAELTGALVRPGSSPVVSEEVVSMPPLPGARYHPADFLAPMGLLAVMIFVGLYVTGKGNPMEGSGSTAVLWAVCSAIGGGAVLYALPVLRGRRAMSIGQASDLVIRGSSGLVAVTFLVVLAFALGNVTRALGMGEYLAGWIGTGAARWLPLLVFVIGCSIAFALGSSWATFALLIPVGLPLASALHVDPALVLGAVLSSGVFGDHASPLSDTTIISSMAAACDLVDHTRTQLSYALLVAGASAVLYLIAGFVMA